MKSRNPTTVKKGDRVRLISMYDPYSTLSEGATGTVDCIDAIGTIHVRWDCGSRLGLIAGVDSWKIIKDDEDEAEIEKQSGKAYFIRKASDLKDLEETIGYGFGQDYIIEDIVTLSPEAFKHFSNNLLDDVDFISERKKLMRVDHVSVWHCILVQSKEPGIGILVECEGYDYARYSALLPESW